MSATIAYLRNRNYTGIDDIDQLKADFYKAHIVVSYDAEVVDGKRRVIFTATKGMRSQKFDKITYECNGLILEAPTWNPLVVPCPMPKSSVNNETFSRMLNRSEYKVYKITDGTIFYVYYWNASWRISTARGLDMAQVVLNGFTYEKLISDVLAHYATTWQAFTGTLNTAAAYSFVFSHSELHPFMSENNGPTLMFIHRTTVEDGKIIFDRTSHGLPYSIAAQEELIAVPKLRQLYSSLATSLQNWLTTKKNPLFGYLFISTAPYRVGGDHSCVLLESSLMRMIRQSVYDRRFMEYGANRTLATVITGYLGPNRTTFIELFPQHAPLFAQLDTLQNGFVQDILRRLTITKLPADDEKATDLIAQKPVDADAVDYLANLVQKKITIKEQDADAERHVTGIINNTKYVGIYMDAIKATAAIEQSAI